MLINVGGKMAHTWTWTQSSKDSSEGSCCAFTGEWSNASSIEGAKKAQPASFAETTLKTGDFELVSESVVEDYDCPVCLSLMSEPHLTNCGHRFCKGCIEPIYHGERKCPVCQEPGFKMMPDKDIERRIKGLEVYCINRRSGCDWTGEVANREDHLLKRCDYLSIDCKLEMFGCGDKVPRKDQAMHISDDIIRHMTLVVEQYEAKQKEHENQLSEKDAKISQLEQRINDFEGTICYELERKSDIKWTPIHPWHKIYVINEHTPMGMKQHFVPENIVPRGSKELLILLATHSEFSWPHKVMSTISVFVEEEGVRYSKFIKLENYEQRAWSDNSDNVWLPLPTNRVVYVDVPVQFGKMFWCDIHLIGYR
jgi:hypothetical protein